VVLGGLVGDKISLIPERVRKLVSGGGSFFIRHATFALSEGRRIDSNMRFLRGTSMLQSKQAW
jgi:hypothetical protein